jgi:ferredoxin
MGSGEGEGGAVRVAIDRDTCTGHAQCSAVCPSVFGSDEYGYAVLVTADGVVPAGDEDNARLAVDSCPEQALSVLADTAS